MESAEIFTGCGGLAMGLSRAGMHHRLMVERDADAVATACHNRDRNIAHVRDWPITEGDVRDIAWTQYRGELSLIAGGPPCQPFGIGGKKAGHEDARDMWPEAVRAIREARPDAFVWENVRNLAGPKFRDYLGWIVAHLTHPDLVRKLGETHIDHLARLSRSKRQASYDVRWQLVNAADYGAPQVRWRVIIDGLRSDLNEDSSPLTATHSRDALLWDQWVSGKYWKKHKLPQPPGPTDPRVAAHVMRLNLHPRPSALPWVTVRDALMGLGAPDGRRNHVLQPGARQYPGHTGSDLDLPSKALKAGDHGVPGGENMMVLPDGTVRYYTTREAARLVGLPDDYLFPRSWSESMRQLGNAVPVKLGEAIGEWIKTRMTSSTGKTAKAA